MTKNTHIYLLLLCIVTFAALAQPTSKRDKIEALRVSFINQKVDFTSQEAQLFWPLYNEYNDKMSLLKKTFRQQFKNNTAIDFVTDKDAELYLLAELTTKQKELDLYKEYYDKFKKVMPIKKVALLRKAEDDFKKELIKNIKGNSPD